MAKVPYVEVRNGVTYLAQRIVCAKRKKATPQMTVGGYSRKNGSPTEYMICLLGENRWRRVYHLTFSNVSSYTIHVGRRHVFVNDSLMDDVRKHCDERHDTEPPGTYPRCLICSVPV